MVDIHCHILPGTDDGAPDEATAIAMCRLAAESGTTDLVATPHANDMFPFSPESNEEKRQRLQSAVGPVPRIHLGCDFRLSYDNIEAALATPTRFTINGHQYLLVEFSDQLIAQGTSEVFARMRAAGLTPIITHPERNPLLRDHGSRLAVWVDRGCLIQVTGGSLLGAFGDRARRAAMSLLDAGLVHIVASDGHDLERRPPVLADSFEFIADRWGDPVARRLLIENPGAVVEGAAIDTRAPKQAARPWWAFWK